MNEEPALPNTGLPPELPAPEIAAPPPERVPFWGYGDAFLLAGLALPCMFAGFVTVRLALWILHLHAVIPAAQEIPGMTLGYLLLFGAMMAIFRMQYDRPFWRSLGWVPARLPFLWNVFTGLVTGLCVAFVAGLLRTPPASGPLVEMMNGRAALIMLAIFGTTLAPLFEELAFRGFLQPLLVRSLGVTAGIFAVAILFGGLHYWEYGASWRSALLVALAGTAFGWMRQLTGSTRASVIMHASFNALSFISLFAQGRNPLQ